MRNIKLITTLFLITTFCVHGQKKSSSKIDSLKVEIYTSEERDNLQYWFHEKIGPMAMSDTTSDQYFAILTKYGYKIGRLNDKDQSYTNLQIMRKVDSLVVLQNSELKLLLTEKQFELHQENYKDIIYSIKTRLEEVD